MSLNVGKSYDVNPSFSIDTSGNVFVMNMRNVRDLSINYISLPGHVFTGDIQLLGYTYNGLTYKSDLVLANSGLYFKTKQTHSITYDATKLVFNASQTHVFSCNNVPVCTLNSSGLSIQSADLTVDKTANLNNATIQSITTENLSASYIQIYGNNPLQFCYNGIDLNLGIIPHLWYKFNINNTTNSVNNIGLLGAACNGTLSTNGGNNVAAPVIKSIGLVSLQTQPPDQLKGMMFLDLNNTVSNTISDTSKNYMQIPSFLSGGIFTVCFWVNKSISNSNYAYVFDFGNLNPPNDNFGVYYVNDTLFYYQYSGNTLIPPVQLLQSAVDTRWHHIALSINSAQQCNIYVDNMKVNTVNLSTLPVKMIRSMNFIGGSGFLSNNVATMYLSDFRYYQNTVLNDDQISAIYNGASNSNNQDDAGKIGYGTFDANALDIVGAGALSTNRHVRLWDCVSINTPIKNLPSYATSSPSFNFAITGNSWMNGGLIISNNLNVSGMITGRNQMNLIESVGSLPSSNNITGTLILSHTNTNGGNSVVFLNKNAEDYGYISYEDSGNLSLGISNSTKNIAINGNLNLINYCLDGSDTVFIKIYNASKTSFKPIICAGVHLSPFNLLAITSPTVLNGIASGPGNSINANAFSAFNVAINSSGSVGFVDTTNQTCNLCIDNITGNISSKGNINVSGTITTPLISFREATVDNLLVTVNGSITSPQITCNTLTVNTNITCPSLTTFINTSITTNNTNYVNPFNTSFVNFVNTSLVNVANTKLSLTGGTMTGILDFTSSNNMPSSSLRSGARIRIWDNGNEWAGIGKYDYTTIYNCPTNNKHQFSVNSSAVTYIGETGLIVKPLSANNGLQVLNYNNTNSVFITTYLNANGNYNPQALSTDNAIVYGTGNTATDMGTLSIVPWSYTPGGLRMAGVNNTFTGSLTVAGGAFRSYSTYVGLDSTKLNYGVRFQTFNNTATSGTCYMDFFSVNNIYSSSNLYDARIQCTNGTAGVKLSAILEYSAANHNFYGGVTTLNGMNINENNGNPLILKSTNGTTNNFWLFNTYPDATYLGLRNASSGGWSSVLFAFESRATMKCAGIALDNIQFTGSLTNPRCYNGIEIGTGDGATMTTYNVAINSWFGIGFYNSYLKTCYIVFDTRSGTINTVNITANSATINGALTANSATINGALTANSATINGALTANSATINGALTANSATINGALTATSVNTTSDRRLKTNIQDIPDNDVNTVFTRLKPKQFQYSHESELSYGFIAQDVETFLPSLVNNTKSMTITLKTPLVLTTDDYILHSHELHIPKRTCHVFHEVNEIITSQSKSFLKLGENDTSYIFKSDLTEYEIITITSYTLNDVKTINYIALIPLLIQKIQSMDNEIKRLISK
jgi:autotransporter-associated beta strand protein